LGRGVSSVQLSTTLDVALESLKYEDSAVDSPFDGPLAEALARQVRETKLAVKVYRLSGDPRCMSEFSPAGRKPPLPIDLAKYPVGNLVTSTMRQ